MSLAGIPPLGWCTLGVIAFLFISINLWLFSLWRSHKQSGPSQPASNSPLKQTLIALRDPFAREDGQLKELAQKVDPFKKRPGE